MAITIPLDGMDEPHDYQLVGGPFDGSSINLACDLSEMPPLAIAIERFPERSRGCVRERYVLQNRTISTRDGIPGDELCAYFHEKHSASLPEN